VGGASAASWSHLENLPHYGLQCNHRGAMGFSTIVSHLLQSFGVRLASSVPTHPDRSCVPGFLWSSVFGFWVTRPVADVLLIARKVIDRVDHNKPKSRIV
jgi:hypothetical protein